MQSAPANVEDAQYCLSCEAVMLFERVEAGDHPVDDPAGEWICVTCGSALLVGASSTSIIDLTTFYPRRSLA
jgi:hypothetical protein